MTCPACRHEIPCNMLVCPLCLHRRARDATIAREREYVPRILAGSIQLRLALIPRSAHSHLEFICLAGQSYCGEPLSMIWKRRRLDYDKKLEREICIRCWKMLMHLGEQAA